MSLQDPERQPESHKPVVYCVLINWNGWADTLACVASLKQQNYRSLHVLVVDNDSSDDSLAHLANCCSAEELLRATRNDGFAAGCNLGIRVALKAGADFVWLLNNDTTAPVDTLSLLLKTTSTTVDAAERKVRKAGHSHPGLVGTVLHFMHEPARVQAWGGGTVKRWLGYTTHFVKPTSLPSDGFLTFASVLIRREVFEEIGLLDERFFMYFEDADFCFRAQSAGWAVAVAPETAVLHKEGGSTRKDVRAGGKVPFTLRVSTASGLHFLSLHGRPKLLSMLLFLLSRVAKRALSGDLAGLRAVFAGAADWRRKVLHRSPKTQEDGR